MDLASVYLLVSKLFREEEYQKTLQMAKFAIEYMESIGVQDDVIKGQLLVFCSASADHIGKFSESLNFALQLIDCEKNKRSTSKYLNPSIDHIFQVIVKNRWFTQENVDLFVKIFHDLVQEPRTSREVIEVIEHEVETYTVLQEYEQALTLLSQLSCALSTETYPRDVELSLLCQRNQRAFKERSEMGFEPSFSSIPVIVDDNVRNYENANEEDKGQQLVKCSSAFIMKRVEEIELETARYSLPANSSSSEYLLGVMTLAERFYSEEDWKQALRYSKKCFEYIRDRKTLYLVKDVDLENVKAHCAVLITNSCWFLGDIELSRTFLLEALVYFMSHRNAEYSKRMLCPSLDQLLLVLRTSSTPQIINQDIGMCESFLKELIDSQATSPKTIERMNKTLEMLKSSQSSGLKALELLITICKRLCVSPYPTGLELVGLLEGINP
eukprot:TRINITY_DN1412_c0_g2_i1.p1 TRINITY_DN1412_c0_g2~~TRINITY_DN1412_c0_g2_i1.p1  ORF type:complete len:441 (+),score=88.84 TRINITY_DN1412_c0_g2_i1:31-1353(+)